MRPRPPHRMRAWKRTHVMHACVVACTHLGASRARSSTVSKSRSKPFSCHFCLFTGCCCYCRRLALVWVSITYAGVHVHGSTQHTTQIYTKSIHIYIRTAHAPRRRWRGGRGRGPRGGGRPSRAPAPSGPATWRWHWFRFFRILVGGFGWVWGGMGWVDGWMDHLLLSRKQAFDARRGRVAQAKVVGAITHRLTSS